MGRLFKFFTSTLSDVPMIPARPASVAGGQPVPVVASAISQKARQPRWLYLAILLAGLIGLSSVLAYALQELLFPYQTSLNKFAWLAYLGVFAVMLLVNLTIITPVPVAIAIMIAAASRWDPILISLFASLGGSCGELSGYYIGYIGKKKLISEYTAGYERIAGWTARYGLWVVFLLALQPILPFDIAGLIAGATRVSLWKFFTALWTGKLIKYIIICYLGIGLIQFITF